MRLPQQRGVPDERGEAAPAPRHDRRARPGARAGPRLAGVARRRTRPAPPSVALHGVGAPDDPPRRLPPARRLAGLARGLIGPRSVSAIIGPAAGAARMHAPVTTEPDLAPRPGRTYRYYDLIMVGFVTVLLCSNLLGP